MKAICPIVALAGALFLQGCATSGKPKASLTEDDARAQLEVLRSDLNTTKIHTLNQVMKLTVADAEKFWPIYQHYTNDLKQINDEKYALLKNYAQTWGDMSNQDALIYIRRWLEVDQEVQALRSKYVPVVSQVLTGKGTATFFQLDRRISMMMDIQLASQIPLVHGKEK